jgi:hypothetical protein
MQLTSVTFDIVCTVGKNIIRPGFRLLGFQKGSDLFLQLYSFRWHSNSEGLYILHTFITNYKTDDGNQGILRTSYAFLRMWASNI